MKQNDLNELVVLINNFRETVEKRLNQYPQLGGLQLVLTRTGVDKLNLGITATIGDMVFGAGDNLNTQTAPSFDEDMERPSGPVPFKLDESMSMVDDELEDIVSETEELEFPDMDD